MGGWGGHTLKFRNVKTSIANVTRQKPIIDSRERTQTKTGLPEAQQARKNGIERYSAPHHLHYLPRARPRQKCRLLRCACTTSILRIHPTRRRRYTCIQFAFRYACSRFMFVINLFARVLWCSRFGGGTGLKSGRMEGGSPSTKGGVGLGRRSQLYKDVVNNYANMNCIHFSDALRIIKKIRRRNITLNYIWDGCRLDKSCSLEYRRVIQAKVIGLLVQ